MSQRKNNSITPYTWKPRCSVYSSKYNVLCIYPTIPRTHHIYIPVLTQKCTMYCCRCSCCPPARSLGRSIVPSRQYSTKCSKKTRERAFAFEIPYPVFATYQVIPICEFLLLTHPSFIRRDLCQPPWSTARISTISPPRMSRPSPSPPLTLRAPTVGTREIHGAPAKIVRPLGVTGVSPSNRSCCKSACACRCDQYFQYEFLYKTHRYSYKLA